MIEILSLQYFIFKNIYLYHWILGNFLEKSDCNLPYGRIFN